MLRRKTAKRKVVYHKDGSVWGKGQTVDGKMDGYWEWFRKDGVRMRSGYFDDGAQVGKWTTYDKTGAVQKVTMMKPKTRPPARKRRARA